MNAPNPSGWRPALNQGGEPDADYPTASGDRGLALEDRIVEAHGIDLLLGLADAGDESHQARHAAEALHQGLLVTATETTTPEDIAALAAALTEILAHEGVPA